MFDYSYLFLQPSAHHFNSYTTALTTARVCDGAFAHYTIIHASRAAILPPSIPFTDGAVLPFALAAAIAALYTSIPGVALPGVPTPALGLPLPTFPPRPKTGGKLLIVNGGSSSLGSTTTQLATASGLTVFAICSPANFPLATRSGAQKTFSRTDGTLVDDVVAAVRESGLPLHGIVDAISSPDTYAVDLAILAQLGGGHLACSHPPPAEVPADVQAGMIFAVGEGGGELWRGWVGRALGEGGLLCLPGAEVVGKGLETVGGGLEKLKEGVSGVKLVVEI